MLWRDLSKRSGAPICVRRLDAEDQRNMADLVRSYFFCWPSELSVPT